MPLYLVQDGSFPWDSDEDSAEVVEAETIEEAAKRAISRMGECDGGDVKVALIEPKVVGFVMFDRNKDGTVTIAGPVVKVND